MGTYLCCGIAKRITVEKERKTKEEILERLKESIDLDIYEEPIENERFLMLEIKKEILENYAIDFIEEQLKIGKQNTTDDRYNRMEIWDLKGKKYEELIDIAKNHECIQFELIEGCIFANDISYIAKGLRIYADVIIYSSDGKIIMECYNEIFRYFRNLIIKSSNSPIKTAVVVSIVG